MSESKRKQWEIGNEILTSYGYEWKREATGWILYDKEGNVTSKEEAVLQIRRKDNILSMKDEA